MKLPLADPVSIFCLVMLVIVAAPLLARRAKLPGVVGTILLAALIGPGALGLLARGEEIVLLGTIGLLYLIFTAALSLDLNQLAKLRLVAGAFGLLSFGIPMGIGYWITTGVLGFDVPAALLLSSIVGTHTLLAYPVARMLGLDKARPVVMTVGATAITDTLGLLVLAIVVKTHGGEGADLWFWAAFAGTLVLYVGGVLLLVPRITRWFFRSFPNEPNGELAFVLAMLFLVALVTEAIGLAPLIGAFLAGLAMNRLVPSSTPLMARILFLGDSLFIPFFLVSVGLLVDFAAVFSSIHVWTTLLGLAAALYGGKFAAAWIARRLFGYSRAERTVIFGLSTPQAAATLAVTLVGFDQLGLFDADVVNAVVLLILLSCVAGPMLVQRGGRRAAKAMKAAAPEKSAGAPARILVPLANPATAPGLMEMALAVRAEGSEEPIYPLAVASGQSGDVYAEVAELEKMLVGAVNIGVAAGAPVTPITRVDVNPVEGMLRGIREQRITAVVIGWNGRVSRRERIFGSILDGLLQRSSELTLVCNLDHPLRTTKRVVAVFPPLADRSPGFDEAVRTAKSIGHSLKCETVAIVHADAKERLLERLATAAPDTALKVKGLAPWSRLLPVLEKFVREDDLLLLCSSREGALAWRPALNRLPAALATRFEHVNQVTLYPAEAPRHEGGYFDSTRAGAVGGLPRPISTPPRQAPPLLASLDPGHILVTTRETDLRGLVRAALMKAYPLDLMLRRTGPGTVLRKLLEFELEFAPGVLMLHAPYSGVPDATLLAAWAPKGVRSSATESPVRLVLLLLSPPDMAPERHLANLSSLAKWSANPKLMKSLDQAQGHHQVAEILREAGAPFA